MGKYERERILNGIRVDFVFKMKKCEDKYIFDKNLYKSTEQKKKRRSKGEGTSVNKRQEWNKKKRKGGKNSSF